MSTLTSCTHGFRTQPNGSAAPATRSPRWRAGSGWLTPWPCCATTAKGTKPSWTPAAGLFGQTVCAHAGFGPVRVSQSTGSLVAQLRPEGSTVWLTGTSAPCLSVFKPIWMDTGLPDLGPEPDKYYDGSSLWWRHEDLHRAVLSDYANRAATLRERIAAIEEELQTQTTVFADAYGPDTRAERAALTARAFAVAARAEREALAQLRQRPAPPRRHLLYRRAWAGFDKAAQRAPNPDGRPRGRLCRPRPMS